MSTVLQYESTIEADEAFIPKHLPHAIETILVQELSDNRTALILHAAWWTSDTTPDI